MTNAKLLALAKSNPPDPSWYDEDFTGLWEEPMTAKELIKKLQRLSEEEQEYPVEFSYMISQDGSDWEREENVERVEVIGKYVRLS